MSWGLLVPPSVMTHPVPCLVFHCLPHSIPWVNSYPESSHKDEGSEAPHFSPTPLLSSVVWEMGFGESPAALPKKGAPICPALPLKSLLSYLSWLSVCVSLSGIQSPLSQSSTFQPL